jgi:hypothetical protein
MSLRSNPLEGDSCGYVDERLLQRAPTPSRENRARWGPRLGAQVGLALNAIGR